MKIEVGLTPVGRTIIVSLGVAALALAALAAQGIWMAAPPAGPQEMPDDATDAETIGYAPLFTLAREGGEAILSPVVSEVNHPALFTRVREGSVPVQVGDRSMTFTQAREQWYAASGLNLALFTEEREAAGNAPLIDNRNAPLFTQAREQGWAVKATIQPLFTFAREASGYAQENAKGYLPLFVQAREQGRSVGSPDMPLFTQEREG
jgi:hypothetical protein